MNFHEMGSSSKALQSSWVKRLMPREVEGTWVGSPKSPPASAPVFRQEKEASEGNTSSSTFRCVIHPLVLPKVESVFDEPVKRLRGSPSASVDSRDLVTETQVIASFGPFQVRARSLVSLREKNQQQQTDLDRTAALVPDEHWKQYFLGRKKELTVVTEQNPSATACSRRMIKPCSEDRQENRGGLLGSEIDTTHSSKNKEIIIDRRNKHANPNPPFGPDSDQPRSKKPILGQFEWESPEKSTWNNPGFCKEIVPSSGEHVITGSQKMDGIAYERRPEVPAFASAFHRSNTDVVNYSSGFGQYATSNDLPSRFPVLKQTLVPENRSNHCFMDQQATWKPEAFRSVKANPLEPGSSRREHCHGSPPMLGSHKYGIGQGTGRLNCMENYPIHSPNYPPSEDQRDEIILSDSSSTASLPNELIHRKNVHKKSSDPDFHPGSGTSFRESDVAYYRPIQERAYLEPESNSSHHSNCLGFDQEDNSTRPANTKTRLSKQFTKANDGWSDIKSKGLNFENPLTEQRHAIKGNTGNVFHYKSCDSAHNQNFQENYSVGISHRSGFKCVFPYLAPDVQPVAFQLPSTSREEEEIGSALDGDEKYLMEDKISTMLQRVLPGKESPRDNISFCAGKTVLDAQEFHPFKSRKQSAEEGPSFQRVHILSNDREAELYCNRHVRLKISAVDRETSTSAKSAHCTREEFGLTDVGIANNLIPLSEANTVKDCRRPQMWLQRWIHSPGRTGIVNEQVPRENWNCNPVKHHESLCRNYTQEWSGDNRKASHFQQINRRKENGSCFSNSGSQGFTEGHFKSDLKGSQFKKKLLTSSASAMAILGTRTKEMYAALPNRKDKFAVWASTQRADADAKVTGLEKEMKTSDELEPRPKKTGFEKEIVQHNNIHV